MSYQISPRQGDDLFQNRGLYRWRRIAVSLPKIQSQGLHRTQIASRNQVHLHPVKNCGVCLVGIRVINNYLPVLPQQRASNHGNCDVADDDLSWRDTCVIPRTTLEVSQSRPENIT